MSKRVFYLDSEMSEDWPERIRQAQLLSTYVVDGEVRRRLRYGRDGSAGAESRNCHDCGVIAGQLHVPGCDMERCPSCHCQAISCDCSIESADVAGGEDGTEPDGGSGDIESDNPGPAGNEPDGGTTDFD